LSKIAHPFSQVLAALKMIIVSDDQVYISICNHLTEKSHIIDAVQSKSCVVLTYVILAFDGFVSRCLKLCFVFFVIKNKEKRHNH